ncbi:MAG: hypothetical protein WC637_00425 [Victivallales bacterium]
MGIKNLKVIKNDRAWRRFCRTNDIDYDYVPTPKEYPFLIDSQYQGIQLDYYYFADIEKLRNKLIKAM